MSDSGWTPYEEARPRLPRLEDLPVVYEGYDPGAVAAAFDAFYRHAAQLDTTLSALESVETFRKDAAELRADIRALRAASWGPLPGRQTWAAGYAVRASTERRGGFLDVAPRLAVEAAFIILVAVGAAVAELSATAVVLVVVAAWLVVGLAEALATLGRPSYTPVLRPQPASAEPQAPPAPTIVQPAAVEPADPDPWEAAEEPLPEPEPDPEPEELEPIVVASLAEDLRPDVSPPEAEVDDTGALPVAASAVQKPQLRRGRR